MSPRRLDPQLQRQAEADAKDRDGVISRARLRRLGLGRFAVRDRVDAGRWRRHGRQTIAVHTGELSLTARLWRAVFEVGEDIAVVDGASGLLAAGATGLDVPLVHVSVPHGCRPLPVPGVAIHQVRTRNPLHLMPAGMPRARPEASAVRAAHWAVSDRQAALFLCIVVQQRLSHPERLLRVAPLIRGRRDRLVAAITTDLALGAESLGELDFAALCRARGIPEPQRQVIRRGPRGRVYADVRWRNGLVVEIDGSGHRVGLAVSDDNLRQNALTLEHDVVLRIDLVGLRIMRDEFLDQVERAHALMDQRRRYKRAL